jgi:hypothetical protein
MMALVVALALGGCRAGARNGGATNPTTGQTTTATSATGAGNNAALQQLQTDEQQYQLDQQQITNAANVANTDFSSQDNPLQP